MTAPASPPSTGTPPASDHWHALEATDVARVVASNPSTGLSSAEVQRRLADVGPNALSEPRRRSLALVLLRQFKSPLIYLLLVAGGIAFALGHVTDSVVIVAVVVLNAIIGAVQEGRAERSLLALRKLAGQRARVLRNATERVIEAREVVPGDVLVLESGDAVAADARLLDRAALQISEAALTGESMPIPKEVTPLDAATPIADRKNMVYAGTHVTTGRARAVVVATGTRTEIGRIAELAEVTTEQQTPLERRVAEFGRYIIVAALAMFALVNAIGFLYGIDLDEIFLVGVSQLVGMVPEGLPVAMTIALAVGVQRMARRNAVVRRLAAVETLGSTTVICSDKTGTLTRNQMTVTALWLPEGREVTVTGSGYEPVGGFYERGESIDAGSDDSVRRLVEAGALCNDAQLHGPPDGGASWHAVGDPTEVALLSLAIKAGVDMLDLHRRFPRRAEIPFESSAKMMATQHRGAAGSRVLLKGAPEAIYAHCGFVRTRGATVPMDDAARNRMHMAAEGFAANALRVLAIAEVEAGEVSGGAGFAPFRGRATLLGLVGQLDPPRDEAAEAVENCRRAGIRPVMVTGDHKATGRAIALSLGIASDEDQAVGGDELDEMSDAELAERIESISVFARVHPAQKLRIVEAHQKQGAVVAMTGDGVNDAPALVKADVGVAMGVTGTEVAKEAAEIVIGDDNFATIVAAVEEGRIVYRNIKKVVLYLFSTAAAEVLILLLALLLGYPPPLAAVQILWINLITEGTVTVNLIMEPAEGDEMSRAPISPKEPLLNRLLLSRMAFMAPAMVISTLGWFVYRHSLGVPFAQVQTETFTVLAVCQWFNVLNCRSEWRSALNLSLLTNPWLIGGLAVGNVLQVAVVFLPPLNHVFHTVPFGFEEFLAIGCVASAVLWVEELRKLVVRRRRASAGANERLSVTT